ncbi:hypothetical protein [Ureibacillus chungkukjangi]|uniref:hypothetical protein n=1 Tax=Ureibacillus chungkukjangi TaxID=1202712 RepID=UPI000D3CE01E|nr:hypothetical protein [Ureibacillus chungkukjangi]
MVKKALMYQFMANIDTKIKGKEILLTHRDLSIETGRAEAWFNNSFNNLEDLRISSFLRILAVANERHKANTEAEIDGEFLINIFTSKILETANGINILAIENEAHLGAFIQSEEKLFQDLIGYWGILSSKGKLNDAEEQVLKEMREILNSYNKTEQEEENEQ